MGREGTASPAIAGACSASRYQPSGIASSTSASYVIVQCWRRAWPSCVLPAGSPKKMRCAVSAPPSLARSADGTSRTRCSIPRSTSAVTASRDRNGAAAARSSVNFWRSLGCVRMTAARAVSRGERTAGHACSSLERVIRRSASSARGKLPSVLSAASSGSTVSSVASSSRCGIKLCTSTRSTVRCPTLSVCVPLACGVRVRTLQLQLAPRITRPLNSPTSSGTLVAAVAPKQRNEGGSNSSTRDRLKPAARSASTDTPSMSRRAHCARSLRARRGRRRRRRLHDGAAVFAGAQRQAAEKAVEYRRKLGLDVGQCEELLIEQLLAAFAIPPQTIEFSGAPATLDHQADRVGIALGRMRNPGRQKQDLAGANRQIGDAPVLHYAQQHAAFELMEELLRGIDMEVLAAIGAAHHHDDELTVLVHQFVAHRWTQQMTVGVYPLLEIDGMERVHVDDFRHCPKQG